ncbi:MAG: Outer membrane protein, partial [Rhodospirillaceae bacterium]
HAYREYRLTEQMADIDTRLSQLSGQARESGVGSEVDALKAEATRMLSTLRRLNLYADLQTARARLDTTLGLDPPLPAPSADQRACHPGLRAKNVTTVHDRDDRWQEEATVIAACLRQVGHPLSAIGPMVWRPRS